MSMLADLLESRREELVRRWMDVVREHLAPRGESESELRNHIPDLLQQLVAALRGEGRKDVASVGGEASAGQEHGRQRFRLGFDIQAMVYEYGVLRGCILDLIEESGGAVPFPELRVLSDFLASAITESVAEHERQALGAQHAMLIERHAAEATLRAREEQIRSLLNSTSEGIWGLDTSGLCTFANDACARLLGYGSAEELVGRDMHALVHHSKADGSPYPKEECAIHEAFRAGREVEFEDVLWRKDGTPMSVRHRANPIVRDGQVAGAVVTFEDITRRKAAELARENLLDALAAQPVLLICVLKGPRVIVQMAPPPFLRRVARGRDIRGQPLMEAVPELRGQGFEELLTRVLETGEPFVGREVSASFDRGDGTLEEGFFDVVYQPVRGERGTLDSILAISHEVTDVVHARRRAERLAAEEKQRADFEQQLIGIVSHDLRNPLGAILLGTTALARREELDERSTKAVMRIQASAERAVRLVKDLLDFTQARLGGGLPLARSPQDLHALVRQVVEEVQANFPERELRLEAVGPAQCACDLDRMAQVVTNLTSNALKYGQPGTPVTVRTRGAAAWVELEVHNQGTPIPLEARERLFEPFQRATAQEGTSSRSVGLGLYIVKHIVDAHGGTLHVTSTEAEGTTFTVRLPR